MPRRKIARIRAACQAERRIAVAVVQAPAGSVVRRAGSNGNRYVLALIGDRTRIRRNIVRNPGILRNYIRRANVICVCRGNINVRSFDIIRQGIDVAGITRAVIIRHVLAANLVHVRTHHDDRQVRRRRPIWHHSTAAGSHGHHHCQHRATPAPRCRNDSVSQSIPPESPADTRKSRPAAQRVGPN